LLRKRSSSRFKIEKSTEKYRLRNYFIFDFKFLDELEKINEDTVAEDLEKTFNDSGASDYIVVFLRFYFILLNFY